MVTSPIMENENLVLHSEFDCFWAFPETTNVPNYILKKAEEHVQAGRQTCVVSRNSREPMHVFRISYDLLIIKMKSKYSSLFRRKMDHQENP